MKIRTPEERFANLPGYDFKSNYIEIDNMRVHYLDEGPKNASETVLCLHGEPSWSYLYRKMVPILAKDYRVVAPDLIGFGKSDKFLATAEYTYKMHYDTIATIVSKLKLKNVTIVVQDWGGLLGLPYAANNPHIIKRLVIMNTGLAGDGFKLINSPRAFFSALAFLGWRTFASVVDDMPVGQIINAGCWPPFQLDDSIRAAYEAPYPDKRYKAGAKIFPALVPLDKNDPGAREMHQAREKLSRWQNPCLVMFSDRDPITRSQADTMYNLIPGAKNYNRITIRDAGHFLQEDKGEELAHHIGEFIALSKISAA